VHSDTQRVHTWTSGRVLRGYEGARIGHLIAGLEEVTAGTNRIGWRVVNDVAPKDRDIAMVFQSYALYPYMSVRQSLEFGLRIRRRPDAEIARLVTEVADVLGIKDQSECV